MPGRDDDWALYGARMREVREYSGESREALAEALGVEKSQIFRWECGEGGPRAAAFVRWIEYYGITALRYVIYGPPRGR